MTNGPFAEPTARLSAGKQQIYGTKGGSAVSRKIEAKYWCQQKRYVQTGAVAPIAEIETGDPLCFFKPVIKRLTMNTD